MRIIRIPTDHGERFHLVDGAGEPLPLVAGFVRGLQARGCSPNTIIAYLYDLRRFYQFLDRAGLSLGRFVAAHTVDFLAFLNAHPTSAAQGQRISGFGTDWFVADEYQSHPGRCLDFLRASGAHGCRGSDQQPI